jgi:hypothetical protein
MAPLRGARVAKAMGAAFDDTRTDLDTAAIFNGPLSCDQWLDNVISIAHNSEFPFCQ